MKNILILLAFLPLFVGAQIGQWDSTEVIIYPTSTTGKVPLSITDTIYLIDVHPSDSGNAYISRLSGVQMIYDFNQDATDDTIYASMLFQNYDYDSLFYSRVSKLVTNQDGTLNKPERITEIKVYASASSSSIPVPVIGDIAVKPSGGDYDNLAGAIAGASIGDVIDIYASDYISATPTVINKNVILRGVGDVLLKTASGANVVNFNGTTDRAEIKNVQIDAERTVSECVLNTTIGKISNCVLKSANLDIIDISSTGDTVQNCVFLDSCRYTIDGHYGYISENYFNLKTGYLMIGASASPNKKIVQYNKIDINKAITACDFFSGSGSYQTRFNEYNVNEGFVWLFRVAAASTGTNNISYNTFNINVADKSTLVDLTGSFSQTDIINNTFNYTTQLFDGMAIRSVDQSNINISSNTVISTSSTFYTYFNFFCQSATIKTNVSANYNFFDIKNLDGYGIKCSFNDASIYENTIEKPEIIGNKFIGSGDLDNDIFHSILLGFQKNPILKYNDFEDIGYGVVLKSQTVEFDDENISYNTAKNCAIGFRVKGVSYVDLYNNTLDSCRFGVFISNDDGVGLGDSTVLVNNIISNSVTDLIKVSTGGSISRSDTNVVFNGTFNNGTFATWQGLGYDKNSYNTDPNYKSATELWPIQPSDAIGNGLNLGATYENGLSTSSVWPDGVITTPQLSSWSIGAFVVPLGGSKAGAINSFLIIDDEGYGIIFQE